MSTTLPDTATPPAPAQLAKAAFKRLALERQEPTPENFRTAYAAESAALGWPVPEATATAVVAAPVTAPVTLDTEEGPAWSELIGRIARGLERSNKQWTAARRKDSLQRVLAGSKQSSARLLQRLQQLVLAWDSDKPEEDNADNLEVLDSAQATSADQPSSAVSAPGTSGIPAESPALDEPSPTVAASRAPSRPPRAGSAASWPTRSIPPCPTRTPRPPMPRPPCRRPWTARSHRPKAWPTPPSCKATCRTPAPRPAA